MVTTKEVVGTHGVYNFKPGSFSASTSAPACWCKLEQGKWKLLQ